MHFMVGLAIFVLLVAYFPRTMLLLACLVVVAALAVSGPRPPNRDGNGAPTLAPGQGGRPPRAASPRTGAQAGPRLPSHANEAPAHLRETPHLRTPPLRLFFLP